MYLVHNHFYLDFVYLSLSISRRSASESHSKKPENAEENIQVCLEKMGLFDIVLNYDNFLSTRDNNVFIKWI